MRIKNPFVVKHYGDDPHPTIKGNGFDGLVVGDYRDEAVEFIDAVNEVIATINAEQFHSNRICDYCSITDEEKCSEESCSEQDPCAFQGIGLPKQAPNTEAVEKGKLPSFKTVKEYIQNDHLDNHNELARKCSYETIQYMYGIIKKLGNFE